MSSEYAAAIEIKEPLVGIEQSLDIIYERLDRMPTLRQLYAGMAMQGLAANHDAGLVSLSGSATAIIAVEMADALIAELNKDA